MPWPGIPGKERTMPTRIRATPPTFLRTAMATRARDHAPRDSGTTYEAPSPNQGGDEEHGSGSLSSPTKRVLAAFTSSERAGHLPDIDPGALGHAAEQKPLDAASTSRAVPGGCSSSPRSRTPPSFSGSSPISDSRAPGKARHPRVPQRKEAASSWHSPASPSRRCRGPRQPRTSARPLPGPQGGAPAPRRRDSGLNFPTHSSRIGAR
jgi:hypothetical protein